MPCTFRNRNVQGLKVGYAFSLLGSEYHVIPLYSVIHRYTGVGGGYFPLGSRYVLVSALCSRGWVLDWRGVVMCRVSRCWRVVAYETIGKGTPVG